MASSKKHPFNPVAPVFGKMPDLKKADELLSTIEPDAGFSSKFLSYQENVTHAKAVFDQVRTNGKGKVLFESVEQFLSKLDEALLHFENFRSCVASDDPGDLNDQRDYFKRLKKTVSSLNHVLADMNENHSRRLAHAGFILPQHLTGEGLDNDYIQHSKDLESATQKVQEGLKGRNSGRHAELYLLIEQLADMHQDWPTRTTNHKKPENKGALFDLINAIYPLAGLSNTRGITDNTIIDD